MVGFGDYIKKESGPLLFGLFAAGASISATLAARQDDSVQGALHEMRDRYSGEVFSSWRTSLVDAPIDAADQYDDVENANIFCASFSVIALISLCANNRKYRDGAALATSVASSVARHYYNEAQRKVDDILNDDAYPYSSVDLIKQEVADEANLAHNYQLSVVIASFTLAVIAFAQGFEKWYSNCHDRVRVENNADDLENEAGNNPPQVYVHNPEARVENNLPPRYNEVGEVVPLGGRGDNSPSLSGDQESSDSDSYFEVPPPAYETGAEVAADNPPPPAYETGAEEIVIAPGGRDDDSSSLIGDRESGGGSYSEVFQQSPPSTNIHGATMRRRQLPQIESTSL